jgi:hypothetical protein
MEPMAAGNQVGFDYPIFMRKNQKKNAVNIDYCVSFAPFDLSNSELLKRTPILMR